MSLHRHGDFHIEVNQDVVTVQISGGFNLEGMVHLHQQIWRATEQCPRWGILFVGDSQAMATPEALETAVDFTLELEQRGCVAVAVCSLNQAMKHFSCQVQSQANLPFTVAASPDDGENFIRARLKR